MDSKRPSRDSSNPFCKRTREDPRRMTLRLRFSRVSRSHSFFTCSLQVRIFWTSSMMRMRSCSEWMSIFILASCQRAGIQAVSSRLTPSADKKSKGMSIPSVYWPTRVDFPTWRGPMMICIRLRGSAMRLFNIDKCCLSYNMFFNSVLQNYKTYFTKTTVADAFFP